MARISYARYARSVDAFEGRESLEHRNIQKAKREAEERREKALNEKLLRARILEAA